MENYKRGFETGEVVTPRNCPGCCWTDADVDSVENSLAHHHGELLTLCEQLENLADGLPNNVQEQDMVMVARLVFPVLKRSHKFEEEVLFPLFELREKTCALLKQSLERLRFEHWEDESYAVEISTGLLDFVDQPARRNPEALGYMLRGFFEGVRRHVAFEKEHVVPRLRTCGVEFA